MKLHTSDRQGRFSFHYKSRSVRILALTGIPAGCHLKKVMYECMPAAPNDEPGEGSCRSPDWPTGSAVDNALVERE